jgi:hypothetical protein
MVFKDISITLIEMCNIQYFWKIKICCIENFCGGKREFQFDLLLWIIYMFIFLKGT